MGTHTLRVSKNIAISDEVYERLKREKGDRSFSEVIADHLESGGELDDVSGQAIFDEGTYDTVKEDIGSLSERTADRLDE